MREKIVLRFLVLMAVLVAAACGGEEPKTAASTTSSLPKDIQAIVDAPDRDEHDKKADPARKPGETLAFFGVKPGMKVFVLGAGNGYTAELLVRAVGPTGVVYVHYTQAALDDFDGPKLEARLAKPINKNMVKVVRDWTDPFPPEARDLDAVYSVITYHDLVWLEGGVDRSKMNAGVMRALRPGGTFGIIDHSARVGAGTSDAETLHRIEESVVRREIEAAGFTFVSEGDFLRNPQDHRDKSSFSGTPLEGVGPSDRFVHKYVKP